MNRLRSIMVPVLALSLLVGQMQGAMPVQKSVNNVMLKTGTMTDRAEWFRNARFGMFIHWGLYSVLGGTYNGHTMPDKSFPNGNSWYSEWIQQRLDIPGSDYRKLVGQFNPVKFDAEAWAREAYMAGMKYVVLTSKHHDGFALWDSKVSNYDLGATPCKRDLIGELAAACRKYGLKFGLYYSHWQDWEHPGGAVPSWPGKVQPSEKEFAKYWKEKCLPQVKELLIRYKPDLLWFDTWDENCASQITLARRDELIDLIRSIKPDCLINGRICAYNPGPRVDYISANDNEHPDKNPGRPWQTPATMNHTWAWHAHDFNWKSSGEMIKLLVTNASLGGNYLLNIGPRADGTIPAPSIRRLREIGGWLVANGESVFGTQPIDDITPPEWGRLTMRMQGKQKIVYAHVMKWENGTIDIPEALGKPKSATILETGQPLQLAKDGQAFMKPDSPIDGNVCTVKLEF